MKVFIFLLYIVQIYGFTLNIGSKIVPPFIQYNYKGELEGFNIDFLDEMIKYSNMYNDYNVTIYNDIESVFDSLENNVTDLGFSAITKTINRENRFDFTHSYFDSGLQIMVPKSEKKIILKVFSSNYIKNITSSIFIVIIVYTFFLGHIMWLLETRLSGVTKDKVLFNYNYFRGIVEAIVWVFLGSVGKENRKPNSRSGKTCSMLINFLSIWIAPIITSYITLVYISESETINIKSVQDLAGKQIGTVVDSIALNYLRNEGLNDNIIQYQTIDEMFMGIEKGEVYANVYDFPVLNYYISDTFLKTGFNNLTLSGPILYKQKYGIIVNDIIIEEEINRCILKILNSPYYDKIYNKWVRTVNINNNNDQTIPIDNIYMISISVSFGIFIILMWIIRHAKQLSTELEFMKGDTFNELDYYYWKLDNILNFNENSNNDFNLEDLLHLYSKNMRMVSDKRRRKDPDANYTEHELLVKIITIIRLIEIECEYSWKRSWDLEKYIKKDVNRSIFILDKKIDQINIILAKIFEKQCPDDDSIHMLDVNNVKLCNSDSDSDCGCVDNKNIDLEI